MPRPARSLIPEVTARCVTKAGACAKASADEHGRSTVVAPPWTRGHEAPEPGPAPAEILRRNCRHCHCRACRQLSARQHQHVHQGEQARGLRQDEGCQWDDLSRYGLLPALGFPDQNPYDTGLCSRCQWRRLGRRDPVRTGSDTDGDNHHIWWCLRHVRSADKFWIRSSRDTLWNRDPLGSGFGQRLFIREHF